MRLNGSFVKVAKKFVIRINDLSTCTQRGYRKFGTGTCLTPLYEWLSIQYYGYLGANQTITDIAYLYSVHCL